MKLGWAGGWAVPIVLATLGCEDPRGPFDLDALVEPAVDCVTVVHESLDLGGPLHRFVGDSLGSPGGWGLVTLDGELTLVRVPASSDEPATASIPLGLPEAFADAVELRGGVGGELWVLSQAGDVSVIRVLPEHGEVARNDSIAYFPAFVQDSSGCPTTHTRSFLFIEGRPYVLALPDCAGGPALSLHLLALEPETLAYEIAWQLSFDPCDGELDPISCAFEHGYWLESIGTAGSTPHTELERVAVAFTQVRAFGDQPEVLIRSADISLLDMRMLESGPHARLVNYRAVWTDYLPFGLGSLGVTRDPYSTQLHVRNAFYDDDAALVRLDTIAEYYSLITSVEQQPLTGRGRLVQLENSGAMMDVEDGALQAVPLRNWPDWATYTLLELDDLVDFEISGIGQLLLRREQAPPQVVHVACLE
jgi:hypothetical protein